MKTNIQNILKKTYTASRAVIKLNQHEIAAIACGAIIGILVVTNTSLLENNTVTGQVIERNESNTETLPLFTIQSSQRSIASSETSIPSLHPAAEKVFLSSAASVMTSSESSQISSSVRSAISSSVSQESFPAFDHTSFPVSKVPNWGTMRTPDEWNRSYKEMTEADFISVPRYDLTVLTTPMDALTTPLRDENIPKITAKLFYSTRFFGSYNLDAGEFTGTHPALDLKLARGTPIGAIAGGRVSTIEKNQMYGLHVVIEHRLKSGEVFFSLYGHFDATFVNAGDTIVPGKTIGIVGMTGNTTASHLHLQIDHGIAGEAHHIPYLPSSIPSTAEAGAHVVNPINFIGQYRNGE